MPSTPSVSRGPSLEGLEGKGIKVRPTVQVEVVLMVRAAQ